MYRIIALVAVAGIMGCSAANPAEVSEQAGNFSLLARWTATSAPIAPATVTGELTFEQRTGYQSDVTFVVSGPPNGVFQWRIFKRDCTVNVAATGALNFTGASGLYPYSTTQSYPDITLDASGKATIRTHITGMLDSLMQYSVRIRPTATTTFNGVNPAACGDLKYARAN